MKLLVISFYRCKSIAFHDNANTGEDFNMRKRD